MVLILISQQVMLMMAIRREKEFADTMSRAMNLVRSQAETIRHQERAVQESSNAVSDAMALIKAREGKCR